MLDRESTFALPETVQLLKTAFIPVAIDQAYQRRQKDTEGDFYRKVASQSPRNDFNNTTQGNYVATATGKLLLYNNNRDPKKLLRLIKKSLQDYKANPDSASPIQRAKIDARYNPTPPKGGLIVRVQAKVLGGYEPTEDRWQKIFQSSISRDNLWISSEEHKALTEGQFPKTLVTRIARFHLVDNTRGEPPMWRRGEINQADFQIKDGTLTGDIKLETSDGSRGYQASARGHIETDAGKVAAFDMIVLGEFWGEGRFTRNAPSGKFPLAIKFTLADGTDLADSIPPQGSRGWLQGYMEP